jgi:hypothetical protein
LIGSHSPSPLVAVSGPSWEDVTIKKRPYETTSIRIDPGIVHLITRIAWEPERTPRKARRRLQN